MQHKLTLEQVEADPWLLVKVGKVRYFYPGQPVTWKSRYIGVHQAVVVRPYVAPAFSFSGDRRWKWVTNLGLPQPPSSCLIAVGDSTIDVDVDELQVGWLR